jgi:hypothetical protein
MKPIHLSLGVIIAIALIFYWWHKDHPQDVQPATRGELMISISDFA